MKFSSSSGRVPGPNQGLDARVTENPQGHKGTETRVVTPRHMRTSAVARWRWRPPVEGSPTSVCVSASTFGWLVRIVAGL